MKLVRYLMHACGAFAMLFTTSSLQAQSCAGNLLTDAAGYYGGFESGAQSIGAGKAMTDLAFGSFHGGYQIVNTAIKPWEDTQGGGYLDLSAHSGNYMMLIHTDPSRQWYKAINVTPGQTYNFSAWIASAKTKPVAGFEVRLQVKYGSTTTVIATSTAKQGAWSQISANFTVPAGVTSIEFQLVDPYSETRVSNFLYLDDICIRDVFQLHPDVNATHVNIPITGSVKTNDVLTTSFAYGTPVPVAGNPTVASITITTGGTYTFSTPVPGVYQYRVPVCVAGQSANCPQSLLTITVQRAGALNNPPVANTDIAETKEKTPVQLQTLANDAAGSVNGSLNPASVTIIAQPKNGTAVVNTTTGVITYTPNNTFSGNDTLRYQVCDRSVPTALCATSLQVITVRPGNAFNSTVAADDYSSTSVNTPVLGNVKTNDGDAEGHVQIVTAQVATVPGKGTLTLLSNGAYTFTPAFNYTGPVSFVYTTCDNGLPAACANATLYILVQPYVALTPLPVHLLSFTGQREGGVVRLNWSTSAETASKEFIVEHSTNGVTWKVAGTVKAAGNSSATTAYGFTHQSPANGSNLYRLQLVDANGTRNASDIVRVNINGNKAAIKGAYPNPFAGRVSVLVYADAASKVVLELYTVNGNLVQQTATLVQAGETRLSIDRLETLSSGTYVLKATIGNTVVTEKLFKQ